jgi:hypothetical protein
VELDPLKISFITVAIALVMLLTASNTFTLVVWSLFLALGIWRLCQPLAEWWARKSMGQRDES